MKTCILKNPHEQVVAKWKASTIVYYFDDNKNAGIIIESDKFYEGEIHKGMQFGFGVEYFPMGLVYTVTETADDHSVKK